MSTEPNTKIATTWLGDLPKEKVEELYQEEAFDKGLSLFSKVNFILNSAVAVFRGILGDWKGRFV